MKRTVFVIVLYSPSSINKTNLLSFKNVIHEIFTSSSISLYNNEIHILSDETDKGILQETCAQISHDINFRFLGDSYDDYDTINQHLNAHLQRGIVSTDAQYYMVLSSNLPALNNRVFTEDINWDSDISIIYTQNDNSALIVFQKQFTPFFFKLSDESIKTGTKSVTLFQQYKRSITISKNPFCYTLDNISEQDFEYITQNLKREKNIYQSELYRLLHEDERR